MELTLQKTSAKKPRRRVTEKHEKYRLFLQNISLFNAFSESALDELLTNIRVKHYNKGDALFLTGDKAEFLRIVVTGWVKLHRLTRSGHEVIVSMLSDGDVFGKSAIINKGSSRYTAEAVTDTVVLQVPASFILHMAQSSTEYDHFLNRLLEVKLSEIDQLELRAEHLEHMTSAQRLGCFLLRLCHPQGSAEENSAFVLPYEKALVAGKLGMTAETFSRSLNQLTGKGIKVENASGCIRSIPELRSYVCAPCSATRLECPWGEEIAES